jgi:hypothetical protein
MPPEIPVPSRPLEYAMAQPRRPGILTAVGIISIVLGSLSVLMSLSGVGSGIVYIVMSHINFPVPSQQTMIAPIGPTTAPATTSNSPVNFYYSVHTPGGTATTSSAQTIPFPFHVALGPSILMIVESSLSLGVAIFLIIAGSLMLRNSPSAARLHRIYVVLKVPLIVAAALATYWTFTSMMNSLGAMNMPGQGSAAISSMSGMMGALQAAMSAAAALIYPVALLIVLAVRSNKEYFAQLRSARQ